MAEIRSGGGTREKEDGPRLLLRLRPVGFGPGPG